MSAAFAGRGLDVPPRAFFAGGTRISLGRQAAAGGAEIIVAANLMVRCLIGLGSNVGDRAENLTRAVDLLAELPSVQVLARSRWHSTQPIGGPAQGQFLNAAVAIETSLGAQALFDVMRQIEAALGRQRLVRWGPRTIDIDLLLYGEQVIDTPEMTVPHPRMALRSFVLEPAAQVAADWRHPTIGWTIERLWRHLQTAPPYVAVTGNIATGKSSLAARIAQRDDVRWINEHVEPRRLAEYYTRAPGRGVPTELEFLTERREQLLAAATGEAAGDAANWWLSDYWFDQSLVFASVWLSPEEQAQVARHWQALRGGLPHPKLLVVLEAPVELLLRRIGERGRIAEQSLTADNLRALAAALEAQIDTTYEGPLLRLPGDDLDGAAVEVSAALEGMQVHPRSDDSSV